jgi:CheY-like chemotaxis protein
MNGFEVCTVLKRQNFSKEVPVVIFTVSNSEDDRKLAKEAGCNGYFLKPFSSDDLVREVEKYTGRK